MICWKCKKEMSIEKPVRGDECPLCHADLHVCKACEFYESGAHNDCRESSAEFVNDKERGNFCDYFRVKKDCVASLPSFCKAKTCGVKPDNDKANVIPGLDPGISKAEKARSAFNALFGD